MSTGRLGAGDTAIQPTIFDAKADILTATAADTPARLAVGNNGETLVADSSTSTGLRWASNYGFTAGKNKFINGDLRIDQRQVNTTTTNSVFIFDRWLTVFSGGTCTYSKQTFTAGSAPAAPYEAINFLQIVTSGQTTGNFAAISQLIEDVRNFANQTITVSFYAKATTGTPNVNVRVRQNFGTGGSTAVATVSTAQAITSSFVRYSFNVSVPSISGKTISSTDSSTQIQIIVSDDTTLSSGVGIQNNTFQFWGFQAETGSVATAFQTATGTLAGELAACQRYYFRFNADADQLLINSGFANSTTSASGRIQFPVPMRIIPTSLDSANLKFGNYAGSGYAMTSVGFNQTSNIGAQVYGTVSGVTAGHAGAVLGNTNGAYVGFSAEL